MKKTFRFYIALYISKFVRMGIKFLHKNASNFPGKLALKICPDFLGRIDKPKTIIAVTGTNGKTTVCNMIEDVLRDNNYNFLDNKLGSNTNSGIASSLIKGASLTGKAKYDLAVFEIDERSAPRIYPYMEPTYLVCTNLFRDSIMRNAHTDFIANILDKNIPKNTKLVLNGDDLIVSSLAKDNERVYFGIDRLDTDTDTCENIVRDIIVCPKCDSKLEYDFVRYHHIGRAHCPMCDFKSPEINYKVVNVDLKEMKMTLKINNDTKETYDLISNNIINIYNMLAVISVLKELGLNFNQINDTLSQEKIVETRFSKENINGVEVITHLAKGLNPIACSRAIDYARREEGNKAVILILDDMHIAKEGSENITWQYETDYELLNDDSIKQVLVAGPRYLDSKVRLLIAGIPEEKIVAQRDEFSFVDNLKLEGIDKVFILHDLYALEETAKIKDKVKKMIIEYTEKEDAE